MTKQEFLDELRQALSGNVSSESVMDSYRYYATYIEEEIRNGKNEKQVIEELGRPALIARSIIAAQTGAREADEVFTEDGKTKKVKNNPFTHSGESGSKKESQYREEKIRREPFVFDFHAWYAKVIYALLFVLLVLIVFGLLKVSFWLVIHLGIPILIILGSVYLILYFLK